MKFYFKAHYTFAIRRIGWFKKLPVAELISLAVISENGDHFFAINVDFNGRYMTSEQWKYTETLPSILDHHWMRLSEIKDGLVKYVADAQSDEHFSLEFNHFNDEVGCGIIKSLLAGDIKFRNIGQVIDDHVRNMPDEAFGPGSPFALEKMKEGGKYPQEDKIEMFRTHEHFPDQKNYQEYSEQAAWIKHVDHFMDRISLLDNHNKQSENSSMEWDEFFNMHENYDLG